MSSAHDIRSLDLFAGPGGWDEGVRELGLFPLGVELDNDACATRSAAGHFTIQADVSALDPHTFGHVDLLLGSPPCPTFSAAGKGEGRAAIPELVELIRSGARAPARDDIDARTRLVLEPLRFALALKPRWIALEQVPGALEVWEWCADALRVEGYSVWTGTLNAADYGVPQTRVRAVLLAASDGEALPPAPTHSQHGATTLLGELAPWVTMADALGWGATERPYATVAGGTQGGPCYDFLGGSGARAAMLAERDARRWLCASGADCEGRPRDAYASPAGTITGKVNAYRLEHAEDWRCDEERAQARSQPIRLTRAEAGVLQGFPATYPWRGTKTARHMQIGNAIPPPLARAIVAALVSLDIEPAREAVVSA